ncbi:MAG: nucleotide sugar dehydrogenase [Holosporales bacterium]|jgi:UDPglucose 6-dehydrogenase|nr:nucleotide sugar dehydrogenase [Holosporales bacterium]
MKITVIGGGYVGLIAAVGFCDFGFEVGVVDISEKRIKDLKRNIVSFFEPGISFALERFQNNGLLKFSTKLTDFCNDSDVIVVAVQTLGANGEDCDLSYLHNAINDIFTNLKRSEHTTIIIRTAVPIGTCSAINGNIKSLRPDYVQGENFDLLAIPEFVDEGTALYDFISPDHLIIGIDKESKKAEEVINKIYKPIISAQIPLIYTNFETVELIRYAAIGFILNKMAFLNELIRLCEQSGANIDNLVKALSFDPKIGKGALKTSPGIGGSTPPRFLRILEKSATTFGIELKMIKAAIESNKSRLEEVFNKIYDRLRSNFANQPNKSICIFGLPFKSKTNDIRESPSIYVIRRLLAEQVNVSCYDPLVETDPNAFNLPEDIKSNENFILLTSPYEAVIQRDLLVIMTDWMELRSIDYRKISELMNKGKQNKPILIDYRNMFLQEDMQDFEYIVGGGRSC